MLVTSFSCPQAPPSSLNIMTNIASDGGGLSCQYCGRRFLFLSKLEQHMRAHTGSRPFPCPYCQHRARYKGDLTRHIVHVHKKDKNLPQNS